MTRYARLAIIGVLALLAACGGALAMRQEQPVVTATAATGSENVVGPLLSSPSATLGATAPDTTATALMVNATALHLTPTAVGFVIPYTTPGAQDIQLPLWNGAMTTVRDGTHVHAVTVDTLATRDQYQTFLMHNLSFRVQVANIGPDPIPFTTNWVMQFRNGQTMVQSAPRTYALAAGEATEYYVSFSYNAPGEVPATIRYLPTPTAPIAVFYTVPDFIANPPVPAFTATPPTGFAVAGVGRVPPLTPPVPPPPSGSAIPCHPNPTPTPSGGTNCVGSFTPTIGVPLTPVPTSVIPGAPAIPVTITSPDPLIPSFTADDAAQYVVAHASFVKIDVEGPITVTSVQFLTAAQLAAQGVSTSGLAADRLLCLVRVSGTFHVSSPPVRDAAGTETSHVSTSTTALAVFDAHTGNELIVGTGGTGG